MQVRIRIETDENLIRDEVVFPIVAGMGVLERKLDPILIGAGQLVIRGYSIAFKGPIDPGQRPAPGRIFEVTKEGLRQQHVVGAEQTTHEIPHSVQLDPNSAITLEIKGRLVEEFGRLGNALHRIGNALEERNRPYR